MLTEKQVRIKACKEFPWPQRCKIKLWGPGSGDILGPKDEKKHEEAKWGCDKT